MVEENIDKWKSMVDKVDMEKISGDFWMQVNRMPERNTYEHALTLIDENGRELISKEEVDGLSKVGWRRHSRSVRRKIMILIMSRREK